MRLGLLAVVVLLAAGCATPDTTPSPTPTAPSGGPTPAVTTPATPTPPTAPPAHEPRFDAGRAYADVVAQVTSANGSARYRVPGTPGNTEVAQLIADEMTEAGFAVTWHHFNATYGCKETPMHNVVAQRNGTSGRMVLFAAHYDTRPVADKDPDPSRRQQAILGANDGASGVAVLLELARVLPPSDDTVRFLFFDGEDGGGGWAGCSTSWILGSTAYAQQMGADEVASVRALVLVDMIGDHDLVLPREGYTADHARAALVQDEIYDVGRALGHEEVFLDAVGQRILDDHTPFLAREIPAVDLIHLLPNDPRVFPAWHHTLADDLGAVDAESLGIVGETLEVWFAGLADA